MTGKQLTVNFPSISIEQTGENGIQKISLFFSFSTIIFLFSYIEDIQPEHLPKDNMSNISQNGNLSDTLCCGAVYLLPWLHCFVFVFLFSQQLRGTKRNKIMYTGAFVTSTFCRILSWFDFVFSQLLYKRPYSCKVLFSYIFSWEKLRCCSFSLDGNHHVLSENKELSLGYANGADKHTNPSTRQPSGPLVTIQCVSL